MLLRLSFRQPIFVKISCISHTVKRLFKNKCTVNSKLHDIRINVYKVEFPNRLVKCDASLNAGKNENNSPVLSDFINLCSRYLRLLSHLVKSIMSDSYLIPEIRPPTSVRGMTKLERNAFNKTVKIPGLKIPVRSIKVLSKQFKSQLLKLPKIKSVAELSDSDPDKPHARMFLFDPGKCSSVDDLPDQGKAVLKERGIEVEKFDYFTVDLTYDNWNVSDILRAVFPHDAENVSGFSIIGHIAHLNLKPEVEDYKYLIGQVILDKTPAIRTVVNKLNIIDNTFRNFQMELLAGEDNYVTLARENGCVFKFDFSKVYWNSRLGTEHQRIVDLVKKDDVVFDVFAGVGPFMIPAAKKGAVVFANDLNPESYSAMKENVTLNKIKTLPKLYNIDGRDFIKTVVKVQFLESLKMLVQQDGETPAPEMHIVMNLPGLALEFLDTFNSLCADFPEDIRRNSSLVTNYPIIHCYCFSKSDTPEEEVKERAEGILGTELPVEHQIRYVRNVAPNKEMMCLSFTLTPEIIFGESFDVCLEPDAKKSRLMT